MQRADEDKPLLAGGPPSTESVAAEAKAAKKAKRNKFWKEVSRLVKLARPETGALTGATLCLLTSSAVSMSIPFTIGKILDLVSIQMGVKMADSELMRFMQSLPKRTLLAGMIGVFAAGGMANFGRIILMKKAGERIAERLRNRIFDNVIKQEVSFFDVNRTGDIVARLSNDTDQVTNSVTQNMSDGLRKAVFGAVGVGMMLRVNVRLTLTMATIIPPVAAVAAVTYGRTLKKIAAKSQEAASRCYLQAQEKLDAVRTVRAFAQEDAEKLRYARETRAVYGLSMREARARALFFGGAAFSGNCVAMAILYYGGSLVADGVITPGELTSFFMYCGYVGYSLMGLGSFYAELQRGVGASERLFELLESTGRAQALSEGIKLENVQGKIEFKNVAFAYPSRPEAPVLKDLSFIIQPGTNVAVVGKSGAGKTSIAQLLMRFYEPNHGTISIDGHNLPTLSGAYLRENIISLVPQDSVLFATTIRENIAYGRPGATQVQIEAAAAQAHALEFIRALPDGFDTYVGEKGASLSGGQKQRIAIARALIKDPRVLVFDEATSALDAEAEKAVMEAMKGIVKGRSVVTIAHRLSTIKQADMIVVIEDGKTVETGKFSDLVGKHNGKFRDLVVSTLTEEERQN
ncbi:P-loop containing nucleoside triphosphate hydrolase protein [Chytriomyces sp. MP71]|nr:P-loop containing nucleoside triphosphate hydrolase protein [Chytriomyces sp. MP71]